MAAVSKTHDDQPVTERTTGAHGVPLTVTSPTVPSGAGVVVIQEAFGVSDSLVAASRRLAAQGFVAVAPHLYHRVAAEPMTTFAAARPLMASLNGPDLEHDIADAREYLEAHGIAARLQGIVGFCMGGTVSLWQAETTAFGAAVTFYGGGVSKGRWPGVPPGLESARGLAMPWLGLYGDQDPTITTGEVEQLRDVAASTGMPTEIVRYPEASHAFANDPASKNYHAASATDAWARALSWFDAHLR